MFNSWSYMFFKVPQCSLTRSSSTAHSFDCKYIKVPQRGENEIWKTLSSILSFTPTLFSKTNSKSPKTTYAADCRQAASVCQHGTQRVKDLMRDERDTWQRTEMGFVQFSRLELETNVVGHLLMSPIKFHSNPTVNRHDCRYVIQSLPKNVYQPNSCWFVGEIPNRHVKWGGF